MFVIAKRFGFSASHQLHLLPDGHPCRRLHGHNYAVEIQLAADALDRYGFVADFADLGPAREFLQETYDHRHLNDVLDGPPTSERLARAIHDWCAANLAVAPLLHAVRVAESDTSWAEYRSTP